MAPDHADRVVEEFTGETNSHKDVVGKGPLSRAVSDISAELSRKKAVPEVEQVQCECCGISEECTPKYICRVRELFCGRWICGLCAEAVKVERDRMGRGAAMEDALRAHIALCEKFNKIALSNPALFMADAVRELLKKSNNGLKSKPVNIARTSSCIPAITRERSSLP